MKFTTGLLLAIVLLLGVFQLSEAVAAAAEKEYLKGDYCPIPGRWLRIKNTGEMFCLCTEENIVSSTICYIVTKMEQ